MSNVKGIREVAPGKWEVTIFSNLLPGKRAFRTMPTREAAEAFKTWATIQLKAGKVPTELSREFVKANQKPAKPRVKHKHQITLHTTRPEQTVSEVIGLYTKADNVRVAESDKAMLAMLSSTIDGPVRGITAAWVDGWLRHMKSVQRLAPGSIRKRVESLARCIDWWHRATHVADEIPANPLRQLPRGYSAYSQADAGGLPAPRDVERERRLLPGEQEALEATIMGQKREDRQRPWSAHGDPEFRDFFRLVVGTGLRLREAYTLRVADVSLQLRTIHVKRSKTGTQRSVPIGKALRDMLEARMAGKKPTDPIFSYWQGLESERALRLVTNRLSARFASLASYAGCEDLTEHDLRHEATCRWMEMRGPDGQWLFRAEEVRKITGHKTEAMFMRYLSLRGSDLAARLD